MVAVFIVILVLVGLFSAASIAQSVATAKQAQATIEVAETAQMASAGNLAVILLTVLVILLALAVALLWARGKFGTTKTGRQVSQQAQAALPDMNQLIALAMLRMLGQLTAPQTHERPLLEEPQERKEEIVWL